MRHRNVHRFHVMESALIGAAGVLAVVSATSLRQSFAQSTTSATKFEVASIKLTKECVGGSPISSPGRLDLECYSVENLIRRAYGQFANGRLNPPWSLPKVEGGPAWTRSVGYDINAKAENGASRELMSGPMLQALLEDRFKLKVHRETREGPIYALTVAKSGPRLKPFEEGSCVPLDLARGLYVLPPPQKFCDARTSQRYGSNRMMVEAQGVDSALIGCLLGGTLDRPVIDKTGLTGKFDVHIEFAPDQTSSGNPAGNVAGGQTPPSDPDSAPSIFTAVQEQLGLKLEPGRGPVEVLVIDHVDRPSEN
jgi:uncharacterized protein (TIGR03435 family)